jgi:hypothetical protein
MPTATAAVLSANHEPFVLEEVEIDHPKRGEVLVRILATGLRASSAVWLAGRSMCASSSSSVSIPKPAAKGSCTPSGTATRSSSSATSTRIGLTWELPEPWYRGVRANSPITGHQAGASWA